MKTVPTSRIKTARVIAILADFLQIVFFPLFAPGFISGFDDALDAVVCVVLTMLVGWHFAFLPSFVVKVAPMADLAPTWTIAVLIATRKGAATKQPVTTEVYAEPVAPPQIKGPGMGV